MDNNWKVIGVIADGRKFEINGHNIWDYAWVDCHEIVPIKDPAYGQTHHFRIYEIHEPENKIRFAAGEFSKRVWGIYQEQTGNREQTIDNDFDLSLLRVKINRIRGKYEIVGEMKTIGLKSLENFIFHFEQLPGRLKPSVYSSMNDYLNHLQSIELLDLGRKEKAELVKRFIIPLGWIYGKYLDFIMVPNRDVIIFSATVCLLVMIILKIKFLYGVVITGLFLIWLVRRFVYLRKKAAFGLF